MFWGAVVPWTGVVYEKLRVLLDADMALYAVHLPLDFHPLVGNNVEMASLLGWSGEWVGEGEARVLLVRPCCSRECFRERLRWCFPALVSVEFGGDFVGEAVLCSGAAAGLLDGVLGGLRVDTLVTGEARQDAFVRAQEGGFNLYLGGHYQTETLGVRALGRHLAERFHLPCEWVDNPCPL